MIFAVKSFRASSPIILKIVNANDSTLRILPIPVQRGHINWLDSPSAGRKRCRDISSNPKRLIFPI